MSERRKERASYIELRSLGLVLAIGLLILGIPMLLRAVDSNGDNLDDAWEAQYGITTNAYDATNLVGWWQLNGTNSTDQATDISGNGVNGTLTNFPSVAYGVGLYSNALYFATNSSVGFPTTNSALTTPNGFTFSAWIKGTNTVASPATVATWSDGTNSWLIGADTNGAPVMAFEGTNGEQVVEPPTPVANLYDGDWHQLAGTYTATNQVASVYVDGTNAATATITNWVPGAASSFMFGSTDTNSPVNPFVLDEARLYNRPFAANEIAQLPVTYTDLNGSGLSVYDDFIEGLSPIATNNLVTSGFLDSGLASYYGSNSPTLTKINGDAQAVVASNFAANPLVVHVVDGSGNPLSGAPVTFAIAAGSDGGLSMSDGGGAVTSLSMTTNTSGNVVVYYRAGAESFQVNTITATAVSGVGSSSISFAAYCGITNGLSIWLRADTGVTTLSGAVTSIADPIGNFTLYQNTAVEQPTYISNDFNGKPGLRFSGHQWLYSTSTLGSSVNGALTFVVAGASTPGSSGGEAVYLGAGTVLDENRAFAYTSGRDVLDMYGGEAVGPVLPLVSPPTVDAVTVGPTLSTAAFYRNGALTLTASLSAAKNVVSGVTLGATLQGAEGWHGDITEILVYSAQLTAAQVGVVSTYLADKFGWYNASATWPQAYSPSVQYEITRNQWTKAQADSYVAFQAANPTVLTTGLLFWWKADSGVTLSGSSVSGITDQTGNVPLTQATGSSQPTYVTNDINGMPGLRFSGTQWFNSPTAYLGPGVNSDMTLITVGASSTGGGAALSIGSGSRLVGYTSGREEFNGLTGGTYANNGVFDIETTLLGPGSALVFNQDEIQTFSTSFAVTNPPLGLSVGATPSGSNPTQGWHGDLLEERVYDHKLSASELAQATGELADKYGIYSPTATWPLAYSSPIQAQIAKHQWSKDQTNNFLAIQSANPTVPTLGLYMWYRADAGVTTASGLVTGIQDQMGNFPLSQPTSADQPAYVASDLNGLPGLQFSGDQWLQNLTAVTSGLNKDITIVVVGRSTVANGSASMFCLGDEIGTSDTKLSLDDYLFGGSFDVFLDWNGANARGGPPPPVNTFGLTIGTLNSTLTQATFYQNGVQTSVAVSPSIVLQPGVVMGAQYVSAHAQLYWKGDIEEVMVYDHQVSGTELYFIETYLSSKYGLGLSFPNPAPTITPDGGDYSTVAISQLNATSVHYTLDGTLPTDDSPVYTGPLTLTKSCPLTAAYFVNGMEVGPTATAQFYVGDSGNIGISDVWQIEYFGHTGINPNAVAVGGLTYLQDYLSGCNPTVFSNLGDGLSDAINFQLGYLPTDTDINGAVDANGNPIANAEQLKLGLDPFDPVSDPAVPGEPAGTPGDTVPPTITLAQPNNAVLQP
jgi:hypothetical protein